MHQTKIIMKYTRNFLHTFRTLRQGLTVLLFAALLVALMTGCKPDYARASADTGAPEATPVTTEKVEIQEQHPPIQAVGMLKSSTMVKQAFKIGGIIDRIYVDEGDRYRAGQVLATLELSEIDAQVAKARENVAKFSRDQARVDQLYADTVATLEQVQDVATGLNVAQADLKIALYNQKYARIVARRNGKVLKRMAEEGELIAPGTPVLMSSVTAGESHTLRLSLTDKDVVRLKPGDSARVRFDAWEDQIFLATVRTIAPQANPATALFEVELEVEAGKYPLRDGFIARAALFPSHDRGYYRIPMDAVVDAEDHQVRVFLADTATARAVAYTLPTSHITTAYVLVDTSAATLDLPLILAGAAYLEDQAPISIQ